MTSVVAFDKTGTLTGSVVCYHSLMCAMRSVRPNIALAYLLGQDPLGEDWQHSAFCHESKGYARTGPAGALSIELFSQPSILTSDSQQD